MKRRESKEVSDERGGGKGGGGDDNIEEDVERGEKTKESTIGGNFLQ